jgi:hypothetical protein
MKKVIDKDKMIRSLRAQLGRERKASNEEISSELNARFAQQNRAIAAERRVKELESELVAEWNPYEETQTSNNRQYLGDFNTGDTILIVGEVLECSKCRAGNSSVTYIVKETRRRRKC